jgi:site-specific DNA recombinase
MSVVICRALTSLLAQIIGGRSRSTIYIGQAYYNKTAYRERTDGKFNAKRPKSVRTPNPREDWLPVECPAIISKELFDAAQGAIDHHKEMNPRRSKFPYLLAHGRLVCVCGRRMGGFLDHHHGKRYYRCSRKEIPRCGKMVEASWIEARAWDVVECLLELDDFYIETELKRRAQAQAPRYRPEDLDAITERCREIETKRQRWGDAYASGVIDIREFSEFRKGLDQEEAQLLSMQQEIQAELDRAHRRDIEVGSVLELLERVQRDMETYGPEERAKVVQALGLRIIYESRENLTSTFILPADWEPLEDGDILPITIR